MELELEKVCSSCYGKLEWTEDFDREVDRILNTQGLDGHTAVNQATQRFHSKNWTIHKECDVCKGTGKVPSPLGNQLLEFIKKYQA